MNLPKIAEPPLFTSTTTRVHIDALFPVSEVRLLAYSFLDQYGESYTPDEDYCPHCSAPNDMDVPEGSQHNDNCPVLAARYLARRVEMLRRQEKSSAEKEE